MLMQQMARVVEGDHAVNFTAAPQDGYLLFDNSASTAPAKSREVDL
jgi:hypothetical protein